MVKAEQDRDDYAPVPFDPQELLEDPEVRAEYERMKPLFDLRWQMVQARKRAKVSQERMAELMGTRKSNISRLESLRSKAMPNLGTLEKYAQALGCHLKIELVPDK